MSRTLQYAYFSMIGSIRTNHEDNLYIAQHTLPMHNTGTKGVISGTLDLCDNPLIGVFDGMGGESCGEAAAFIAADLMKTEDRKGQKSILDGTAFLNELCQRMNREVGLYADRNRIRSMGATAVCVLLQGQEACFANIGDSRIYLSGKKGMRQITTDQVSPSIFYPKPPLSQYLGMDEDMMLLPQTGRISMSDQDRLLLCTDGVTDMLSDREIEKWIWLDESPQICLAGLQLAIEQAGAKDNATAVLCSMRTG